MADEQPTGKSTRDALELERLSLEVQKLRTEVERSQPGLWNAIQRVSPLVGTLLAVAAFLFGVIQYIGQQTRELAAREHELARQAAARDQDFMKPLWERELTTYFLASDTVGTIATTSDAVKRRAAVEQFWRLYQGHMVILETTALSGAMVAFGECLDGTMDCSPYELKDRALAISTAIQHAIEDHASRRLSEFSKDKFQYR